LVEKEVIYKVIADRDGRPSLLCCVSGEVHCYEIGIAVDGQKLAASKLTSAKYFHDVKISLRNDIGLHILVCRKYCKTT